MSLSREKRETIKKYIMEKIAAGNPNVVGKAAATFSVSPNTIYRYLRELAEDHIIEKTGRTYRLIQNTAVYQFQINEVEPNSEDRIYEACLEALICDLPDNVIHIWYYCFSEMVNNVIEHSQCSHFSIHICRDYMNTSATISDDGIGLFKKICDYYHFSNIQDAILELFKGKLTTDPTNHSGEGIFFSSRLMDEFAAISGGKVFSHTEFDEILRDIKASSFKETKDAELAKTGTVIFMKLSNFSNKTAKEIFDRYADIDGGFKRTIIPIKNVFPVYPVARSQAKRLANRLESFEEVLLDFNGVSEIGQGFAHELFVVFQKKHPEIKLLPINTNEDVQRMIWHVTRG